MIEILQSGARTSRRCINDVTCIMALPAIWSGWEPDRIVEFIGRVLVHMLSLRFVYLRVEVPEQNGSATVESCLADSRLEWLPDTQKVGRSLRPWIQADGCGRRSGIPDPGGNGRVSIVWSQLGLGRDRGVIVAASNSSGFPLDADLLIFRSVINQAAIELQRLEVLQPRDPPESAGVRQKALPAMIYRSGYRQEDLAAGDGRMIGHGQAFAHVIRLAHQVAETPASVLIQGETGTGKELIARRIHQLSDRSFRPFVRLNCAAVPSGLLEAELFGHERGAFTGAAGRRIGRFELADGGTIFLDEIGEIPIELQAKLLRVLQEPEFERLGSSQPIRVDVRVLAATNRNLPAMIAEGRFRSDLYYRLNVFPITMPPLRERREDISELVGHFVEVFARRYAKNVTEIPDSTLNELCAYDWPGNIRELANLIERSVILSPGLQLEVPLAEINPLPLGHAQNATLIDLEREHIVRALDQSGWVVGGPSGAAARLGMKRTSLQYKMQKLGITRPGAQPPG